MGLKCKNCPRLITDMNCPFEAKAEFVNQHAMFSPYGVELDEVHEDMIIDTALILSSLKDIDEKDKKDIIFEARHDRIHLFYTAASIDYSQLYPFGYGHLK